MTSQTYTLTEAEALSKEPCYDNVPHAAWIHVRRDKSAYVECERCGKMWPLGSEQVEL